MEKRPYEVLQADESFPVKAWVHGVAFEDEARKQLLNVARLPFIFKWVAAMPDVHAGRGATIGSVIPTRGAVIPAAVGVDIGCGMMALKTDLKASQLPQSLAAMRSAIEQAVPHGRTDNGGSNDRGAWHDIPADVQAAWNEHLAEGFASLVEKYPRLRRANSLNHLGTLGTGNHFIEVCLDEDDTVWFMLHSGSRGIGAQIGSLFIELARQEAKRWHLRLPDPDLAYLPEGTTLFADYMAAAAWAQRFARLNRELMMARVVAAVRASLGRIEFRVGMEVVNCHHNYVTHETHFGEKVLVTRKGAVRAGRDELGIIPGSMGARSYIVRGKGNPESFESCSHGAGRAMSRTKALASISLDAHAAATAGIECRKDKDVLDESPAAYKSIDAVMDAQADLVEVVHTLRQVVCIKG